MIVEAVPSNAMALAIVTKHAIRYTPPAVRSPDLPSGGGSRGQKEAP